MKHACNEISQLASDSLDRPLSLRERLKFKLHLSMCNYCRDYNHNMKFIRTITEMIRSTRYGQVRLSEQQRQKLHHQLDSALSER